MVGLKLNHVSKRGYWLQNANYPVMELLKCLRLNKKWGGPYLRKLNDHHNIHSITDMYDKNKEIYGFMI